MILPSGFRVVFKVIFVVESVSSWIDKLVACDQVPQTAHKVGQSRCNNDQPYDFVNIFGSVEVVHFLLTASVFKNRFQELIEFTLIKNAHEFRQSQDSDELDPSRVC